MSKLICCVANLCVAGSETLQEDWWHVDQHHRFNWDLAQGIAALTRDQHRFVHEAPIPLAGCPLRWMLLAQSSSSPSIAMDRCTEACNQTGSPLQPGQVMSASVSAPVRASALNCSDTSWATVARPAFGVRGTCIEASLHSEGNGMSDQMFIELAFGLSSSQCHSHDESQSLRQRCSAIFADRAALVHPQLHDD
ncbi:unnamed protein product [Polarella glacialis]|uniref:Uncharacterized protein n=1 Tax=Polarella glacialis TaxID=89957 RepID=A0A813LX20_POLGL|nr:unnamed protein product [Polarella glacialis]